MANSIGTYQLRVDPTVLQSQATELQKYISSTRQLFEAISNSMKGTSNYWSGEAADLYRNRYSTKEPGIEEMFKRLTEHCTDLNQIASVYTGVENQNTDLAQDLSSDVIV